MYKITKLAILISTVSLTAEAATISGGTVGTLKDNSGLNVGSDTLFAVVVSTADDTFEDITAGVLISEGGIVGTDDYILTIGTVTDIGGGQYAASPSKSGFALTNGMSNGDAFILYWFPDLTTSSSTAQEGQFYGSARFDNGDSNKDPSAEWFITETGATSANSVLSSEVGGSTILVASNRIEAVPEPTSLALLGLGTIGLIARRRRA